MRCKGIATTISEGTEQRYSAWETGYVSGYRVEGFRGRSDTCNGQYLLPSALNSLETSVQEVRFMDKGSDGVFGSFAVSLIPSTGLTIEVYYYCGSRLEWNTRALRL